jgi:hypothetical protein
MPKQWGVFDLDGTLANCEHRVHLAREHRWDEFHAKCAHDAVYDAEAALMRAWYAAGHGVAYSTGRTEPYRVLTRLWLKEHDLPQAILLMRAEDDRRPSTVTKAENLDRIKDYFGPGDSIAFIMEDQDKLVAMWRAMGYTCLQPRPGAF